MGVSLLLVISLCLAFAHALNDIMTKLRLTSTNKSLFVADRGINKVISAFAVGLLLPGSMDTSSSSLIGGDGVHAINFRSNIVNPAMASEDIIYKSGKTPEKFRNKNKDDKTGTKKGNQILAVLEQLQNRMPKTEGRTGCAGL